MLPRIDHTKKRRAPSALKKAVRRVRWVWQTDWYRLGRFLLALRKLSRRKPAQPPGEKEARDEESPIRD